MEAAEAIVSEIETLKSSLAAAERQYRESIETTVGLDESLLQAATEAKDAFHEFEAECREKIQKLHDEGSFVNSLMQASRGQWNEVLATPSLTDLKVKAEAAPRLPHLADNLRKIATMSEYMAQYVENVLRERERSRKSQAAHSALKSKAAQKQALVQELKATVKGLQSEGSGLADSVASATKNLEDTKITISAHQNRVIQLKQQLGGLKSQQEKAASITCGLEAKLKALAEREMEITTALQHEKDAHDTEEAARKLAHQKIETDMMSAKTRLRTQQAGMQSLEADLAQLSAKRTEYKIQIENQENKKRAIQQEVDVVSRSIATIVEQIHASTDEHTNTAASMKALHAEESKKMDKAQHTAHAQLLEVMNLSESTERTVSKLLQSCTSTAPAAPSPIAATFPATRAAQPSGVKHLEGCLSQLKDEVAGIRAAAADHFAERDANKAMSTSSRTSEGKTHECDSTAGDQRKNDAISPKAAGPQNSDMSKFAELCHSLRAAVDNGAKSCEAAADESTQALHKEWELVISEAEQLIKLQNECVDSLKTGDAGRGPSPTSCLSTTMLSPRESPNAASLEEFLAKAVATTAELMGGLPWETASAQTNLVPGDSFDSKLQKFKSSFLGTAVTAQTSPVVEGVTTRNRARGSAAAAAGDPSPRPVRQDCSEPREGAAGALAQLIEEHVRVAFPDSTSRTSVQTASTFGPAFAFLSKLQSQPLDPDLSLVQAIEEFIEQQRLTLPSSVPQLVTELLAPVKAMVEEHDQAHKQCSADIEQAVKEAQQAVEFAHRKRAPRATTQAVPAAAAASKPRASSANTNPPGPGKELNTNDPRRNLDLSFELEPHDAQQQAPTKYIAPPAAPAAARSLAGILSQPRATARKAMLPRKSMLHVPAKATPVVSSRGGVASRSSAALLVAGGSAASSAGRSRLGRFRRGGSGGARS